MEDITDNEEVLLAKASQNEYDEIANRYRKSLSKKERIQLYLTEIEYWGYYV